MTALKSQGAVLVHGDGASPEVFTAIADITKITGPGAGKATIIDATTLASTAKEKIPGLPDEGTMSVEINYLPSNTVHKALITDRAAQRLCNFKLTFSDGTSIVAFAAFITSFNVSQAIDAKVTATVELEITGPCTWPV